MPEVFAGSASYPRPSPGPVLSIGNFDGVHLGHRYLLDRLVASARESGAPACVYTFEPPPRVILAPQQHQPRILAWPDKVHLLGEAGVDQVVVERFTRAFAQHPPEWFVDEVLGRRLGPRSIVVGYDFRFGRARVGDLAMIRARLPDVRIAQVAAHSVDGRVCSSSAVRELVGTGEVALAARLLGRPHLVRGTVVAGDQRGRSLGFPTANLESDGELLPAPGVYAVRARTLGAGWSGAVANLGLRPTFGRDAFRFEVHLFDFSGDLYGRELEVAFVGRLRDERRFADALALVAQIRADVGDARALLAAVPPGEGR